MISLHCGAQEYRVFEKNDRFGIESGGKVVIPAVYEKLGWSDGTSQVFEDVVGYQTGKRWGILSIKNKKITENSYNSLTPFTSGYLKASVRGKFSNQLFFGLLNMEGAIKVSFNYLGLSLLEDQIVASSFDPYGIKEGVLSFENEIIVPVEYKEVKPLKHWFVAEKHDASNDVYTRPGRLIAQGIDSVSHINGLVSYQGGKAGYINETGQIVQEMTNKSINIAQEGLVVEKFPTWEIYQDEVKLFEWECDSIERKNDIWMIYLNGAQHLILPLEGTVDWSEYELKEIVDDKWVVQHTKTKKWMVVEDSGTTVVPQHDHIETLGFNFLTKSREGWAIYNKFGSKVSKFPYQAIIPGVDQQIIAKRNDYWAILDQYESRVTTFKYDSIQVGTDGLYAVKFLSRWGIMDKNGNWRVHPKFEEIKSHGKLMVARRGRGYSYYRDGLFMFKSTSSVSGTIGNFLVVADEDEQQGLLDPQGNWLVLPEYASIRRTGDLFILQREDSLEMIDLGGRMIASYATGFQEAGQVAEEYLSVKKNGRWGFMDSKARLRISNRYEEVKPFSEGQAAIKLRGKWGFINVDEKLTIQPFYDFVLPFKNGLAVVKSDGLYGLIDQNGEEIVSIAYPAITHLPSGNYLVEDERGKVGLADSQGKFILRPAFAWLRDLGDLVIIEENGQMGMLDYAGRPRFRTSYRDIRKVDDFIVLKR